MKFASFPTSVFLVAILGRGEASDIDPRAGLERLLPLAPSILQPAEQSLSPVQLSLASAQESLPPVPLNLISPGPGLISWPTRVRVECIEDNDCPPLQQCNQK